MQDPILVVAKHQNVYRWFSSERELWVLDWPKWYQAFQSAGHKVPEPNLSERFGIAVVNENTCEAFLSGMRPFEVKKEALGDLLSQEFPNAKSWWDVPYLFPGLFVDFDNKHVQAFYNEGTPLEKYTPDGWKAEFVDFADSLPLDEQYWVQNGENLLRKLVEAGRDST
jgi:hypothetical protein